MLSSGVMARSLGAELMIHPSSIAEPHRAQRSRPTFDIDRDAQILALWQGRPREQRRAIDVDMFCQWLIDYAPWLVRGADSRETINALIRTHTVEDDETNQSKRSPRRPNQRRNPDPARRH